MTEPVYVPCCGAVVLHQPCQHHQSQAPSRSVYTYIHQPLLHTALAAGWEWAAASLWASRTRFCTEFHTRFHTLQAWYCALLDATIRLHTVLWRRGGCLLGQFSISARCVCVCVRICPCGGLWLPVCLSWFVPWVAEGGQRLSPTAAVYCVVIVTLACIGSLPCLHSPLQHGRPLTRSTSDACVLTGLVVALWALPAHHCGVILALCFLFGSSMYLCRRCIPSGKLLVMMEFILVVVWWCSLPVCCSWCACSLLAHMTWRGL